MKDWYVMQITEERKFFADDCLSSSVELTFNYLFLVVDVSREADGDASVHPRLRSPLCCQRPRATSASTR